MRRALLFSIGLAGVACSLFPDTAPNVEEDGGTAASGGTSSGGTGGSITGGAGGATGGSAGTGGAPGGGGSGAVGGCGGQQTLVLEANRDTYIVNSPPSSVHGSEVILEVMTVKQSAGHRPLVAFEVGKSTLPTGAKLTKATLKLRVILNDGAQQDLGAYRPQRAWTEVDCNWVKYDATNSWTVNGGDVAGLSAQAALSAAVKVGDTVSWDVTSDVTGMISGALGNEGWLLKPLVPDALNGEKLHFASREATDPVTRPKLELTYVVCP